VLVDPPYRRTARRPICADEIATLLASLKGPIEESSR
jgi:hypothetical protein